MKPRKAYLVSPSHDGFGFRVAPVLVLDHDAATKTARIAFLNVSAHSAWVPTAGIGLTVPTADLASTRLRALAQIALRLRDLETEISAQLSIPAPARAAQTPVPATTAAPESFRRPALASPTPGGPRRPPRAPWYQHD